MRKKRKRWLEILLRIALIRLLIVTNLVAKLLEVRKLFLHKFNGFAGYKETFSNFGIN